METVTTFHDLRSTNRLTFDLQRFDEALEGEIVIDNDFVGHFVTTAQGNIQYVDNETAKVLFELRGTKDLTLDSNVRLGTTQSNSTVEIGEIRLYSYNFDGDEISVESN